MFLHSVVIAYGGGWQSVMAHDTSVNMLTQPVGAGQSFQSMRSLLSMRARPTMQRTMAPKVPAPFSRPVCFHTPHAKPSESKGNEEFLEVQGEGPKYNFVDVELPMGCFIPRDPLPTDHPDYDPIEDYEGDEPRGDFVYDEHLEWEQVLFSPGTHLWDNEFVPYEEAKRDQMIKGWQPLNHAYGGFVKKIEDDVSMGHPRWKPGALDNRPFDPNRHRDGN